jgi:hypothetical protein
MVFKMGLSSAKAHEILSSVPYEKGFHFFSPDGHHMGETATTLCFFLRDLKCVGIESVRFHFSRGDFQKWLRTTIGDQELANAIDAIDKNASDETLRTMLPDIVEKRIIHLKAVHQ